MENNIRIVRKLGDEQVGKAIVVIILKNHAHAGGHSAAFREARASIETTFGKRTIAVVVEKKLICGVVRDKNVRESVAVIIGERDPQAMALLRGDAGSDADILKRAVSPIVVEDIGDGGKRYLAGSTWLFPSHTFCFSRRSNQDSG